MIILSNCKKQEKELNNTGTKPKTINSDHPINPEIVRQSVRLIMQDIEKGVFLESNNPIADGWIIKDKKGNEYQRSDLILQCDRIIPNGKDAVPELITWLNNDEGYIRFIAAYSLKIITKEDPVFYTFGEPGKPFNGDNKWFEKAVKTWENWYKENS